MNRLWTLLAVGLATPALAHTGVDHVHSFSAGVLHPLMGADHMLAMGLVGLWAAMAGGQRLWIWPLTFLAGMIAGGVAGVSGMSVPHVELMIAASVLVFGALAALSVRVPLVIGGGLIAIFAAAHGFAHGAEAPATGFAGYAAGFVLATAALHLSGVLMARLAGGPLARIAAALAAATGLALVLS